jgi:hypothetical protein
LTIKIPFSDFDYREAQTSELVSLESVSPVIYANLTTKFVCYAIKFLFSEPHVLFQLITREANGTERVGKLESGLTTSKKSKDLVLNQFQFVSTSSSLNRLKARSLESTSTKVTH